MYVGWVSFPLGLSLLELVCDEDVVDMVVQL
jgi:hypothetical protein